MRYLLLVLIILVTGCSGSGIIIDWEGIMAGQDLRPVVIWTTDHGVDACSMVARNSVTGTYSTNAIDAGMLTAQWTPQRCGLVKDPAGKAYWCQVETASNDLEIFANNATGHQIDGTWALLDDETSEAWEAVDVETRQNYVWFALVEGTPIPFFYYIDLAAGVPALTTMGSVYIADPTTAYSIVLDNMLTGWIHFVGVDNSDGTTKYFASYPALSGAVLDWYKVLPQPTGYPQIIAGGYNELYVFGTASNSLSLQDSLDTTNWFGYESIYSANALTSAYHAAYDPYRNCIHVVLIDSGPSDLDIGFDLIYMRRTPNGWTEQEIIDTWVLGLIDSETQNARLFPQITVQKDGIVINNCEYNGTNGDGELHAYFLANADYTNPVAASWTHSADIANTVDIFGICAPTFWRSE